MSSHQEDLDLLLSLQERVLETPPASPGHSSDDEDLRSRRGNEDLSIFRDAVQDCLDYKPKPVGKVGKPGKPNLTKNSNEANMEKFSGLRIRNQLVTPAELSERFSDIRFVRLPTIKNVMVGDSLLGFWATVGVLTEKGHPKTSSVGKNYCIWKIGCLDESTVSVFLFGDAYLQNCKEQAGTAFALFNCTIRKDNEGTGFSLSAYSPKQILKIGTSVDYGVCKGKRKDGMACTVVINRRQGVYCRYHRSKSAETFSTMRTELKGGNLKTAFRDPIKSRGIYVVNPLADRTNSRSTKQPAKLLSVEGLKRALSKADKVTTNAQSQGIRFLNEMTGQLKSKNTNKVSATPVLLKSSKLKRTISTVKVDASVMENQPDAKRKKPDLGQVLPGNANQGTGKVIELDLFDSDEDI